MGETIDFGQVPAATSSEFLEPGMWRLSIDKENTKLETPQGKTPYLSVRFSSKNGASLTEKFYLTPKALPRLQYLHTAWFDKDLTKSFGDMNEVAEYFVKALTSKIVERPMITGGKETADGKFYSGLPYTGFVVDEKNFEEGAFEKGTARYASVVKKETAPSAVANSNLPVVGGDDLPW